MRIFYWISGLSIATWLIVVLLRTDNILIQNLLPFSAICFIIALLYGNKKEENNEVNKQSKNSSNNNNNNNNKDMNNEESQNTIIETQK